jgi:hypothetical protein
VRLDPSVGDRSTILPLGVKVLSGAAPKEPGGQHDMFMGLGLMGLSWLGELKAFRSRCSVELMGSYGGVFLDGSKKDNNEPSVINITH